MILPVEDRLRLNTILENQNLRELREFLKKCSVLNVWSEVIVDDNYYGNTYEVEQEWNVLIEAAVTSSFDTVIEIIKHFNSESYVEHAIKILDKNIAKATKYPSDVVEKCHADNLIRAKTKILVAAEHHFRESSHKYTAKEKLQVREEMIPSIASIKTIDDVISFYDTYHLSGYLNYRRHELFDEIRGLFSHYNYTKSKIHFIETLHQRASEIMMQQNSEDNEAEFYDQVRQLLSSNLFDRQHMEHGVALQGWIHFDTIIEQAPIVPSAPAAAELGV